MYSNGAHRHTHTCTVWITEQCNKRCFQASIPIGLTNERASHFLSMNYASHITKRSAALIINTNTHSANMYRQTCTHADNKCWNKQKKLLRCENDKVKNVLMKVLRYEIMLQLVGFMSIHTFSVRLVAGISIQRTSNTLKGHWLYFGLKIAQ